jgi:hypothetical protein
MEGSVSRFALLALTIATLAAPGLACAQLQTQGTTIGSPPTATPLSTLTGTVTSIDVQNRTFACLWRSRIRRFSVAPDAIFRVGAAPADFYSLRVGDRVTVRFQKTPRGLIARDVSINVSVKRTPPKPRPYPPGY